MRERAAQLAPLAESSEAVMRALELSGGQVAGENGAARRLGMAPSTLSSRLKALGVRRPS